MLVDGCQVHWVLLSLLSWYFVLVNPNYRGIGTPSIGITGASELSMRSTSARARNSIFFFLHVSRWKDCNCTCRSPIHLPRILVKFKVSGSGYSLRTNAGTDLEILLLLTPARRLSTRDVVQAGSELWVMGQGKNLLWFGVRIGLTITIQVLLR